MLFYFTRVSSNRKTGPMPVVTASKQTCPTSCPLQDNGCYAEAGPIAILWRAVTSGSKGISFADLCRRIRRLPRGQIWRYGQAGDLPGEGDEIDGDQLSELAAANARRPAIVFTHKPPTLANLKHLRAAIGLGLHINLSADSLSEADELASTGLSVVTILSSEYGRKDGEALQAYRTRRKRLPSHTPAGLRIAICPATYLDLTCVECQVCSKSRANGTVMGFPAHANRASRVDAVFMEDGLDQGSLHGGSAGRLAGVGKPYAPPALGSVDHCPSSLLVNLEDLPVDNRTVV